MLTPQELAQASDRLADIYAQLEIDIISEMARSIKQLGNPLDVEWKARMYVEAGMYQGRVNNLIAKYNPRVQEEIKRAFEKSIAKSIKTDNEIIIRAGLTPTQASEQVILAELTKTANKIKNLTLTTAATTQQQFINEATRAYMRVQSGAISYDRSMRLSINALARQGVYTVEYTGSGKLIRRTIEGAVRVNILTGINQTASLITEQNCDKLGVDLVEVSAHSGARPEHAEWQGKIYSRSGNDPNYPDFAICGLGKVDGICGANCRHSFYPYLGYDKMYSEKDLKEIDKEKYKYNGKVMTEYKAEQTQRALERDVRRYKREIYALKKSGYSYGEEKNKLIKAESRIKDFVKQTGLRRDKEREAIGT